MRKSFENELAERLPIQSFAAMMGHSPKIALEHYLRPQPEHFDRVLSLGNGASGEPAINVSHNPTHQNALQGATESEADSGDPRKPLVLREGGTPRDVVVPPKWSRLDSNQHVR
jgi:hypothetical protein